MTKDDWYKFELFIFRNVACRGRAGKSNGLKLTDQQSVCSGAGLDTCNLKQNTLNQYWMGRKAVRPVCCAMHAVKKPSALTAKEKVFAPLFLINTL